MEQHDPYASPRSDLARPATGGTVDTTNPFEPKGRFTRLSWLAWSLVLTVLGGLALYAVVAVGLVSMPAPNPQEPPIYLGAGMLVFQVLFLVLYLILAIRRFHDIDASGWWSVALVVPIANLVAALILLFKAGDPGPNRFGPPRPTPGWEQVVGIIYIVIMVLGLIGIIAAILIPAIMQQQMPTPMPPT
jgi:uncharacterized membrane protein YhaH (DUF805 family)